jgi:hypothetical protein
VIEAVRAAAKDIFAIAFGSEAGNFGYPFGQAPSLAMMVVGVAVLAVVLATVRFSVPRLRTHERAVIGLWLVVAFAAHLALAQLAFAPLSQVVESEPANGFYAVSQRHSAGELLARHDELVLTFPMHVRANLPGKTLFYEGLGLITGSTSGLAYLIILISNLGGVLVYRLAKQWFDDPHTAFYAMVLYLFLPARVYFFPLLNTVSPVLMLLVFWLVTRHVQSRRTGDALLAGVALYALVIFEPLPLAAMPLLGALLANAVARGRLTRAGVLTGVGWIAAGFGLVYVGMRLAFGFDLVSGFEYMLADAQAFNVRAQRPYAVWVAHNLKDFFLNMGLAQSAVFIAFTISAVRAFISSPATSRFSPDVLLPVSFLAVLIVLDLAGINRGETVRLWIFLGVLMQVLVARACAIWSERRLFVPVLSVSIVQTAVCITIVAWIIP